MILKLSKNVVYMLLAVIVISILIMTVFIDIKVNLYEGVEFYLTNIVTVICVVIPIAIILLIKQFNHILNEKTKRILIISGIIFYIAVSIIWVYKYKIQPIDDSLSVHSTAVQMIEEKDSLYDNDYLRKYPLQIGMTYLFAGIYKVFNSTNYMIIQIINILCNLVTIGILYLIFKKVSKDHTIDDFLFFVIVLTFYPLLLLSTFIYSDYMGLAAVCMSVYLLMEYAEKDKKIYLICSALSMAFSYFVKSNYLIFTIASVIYLSLNLIHKLKETELKQNIVKIVCIVVFIMMSIFPNTIFVKGVQKKYGYENESLPTNLWIYMGMSESMHRTNGWYNLEIARTAFEDVRQAKEDFSKAIKERINYLVLNPVYTVKFYLKKTASMWAEPTYQSIWYNMPVTLTMVNQWRTLVEGTDGIYSSFCNGEINKFLVCYGKAINILVYSGTITYLFKNRKKMDLNMMYIMIIFLGGFFFHTIWEAKSRYVLPYFIMIMPVGIVGISTEILLKFKIKKENKE